MGRSVVEKAVATNAECWRLASGGDEQLVILMMYWHVIELLDGAVVLVAAGAIEPSRLQLRAAFEALLDLEFILESDTTRRAYAWLVVKDVLKRIKTWQKFDEATDAGRQFATLLSSEGGPMPFPTLDAKAKGDALQHMLDTDPRWTPAYDEYKRLKQQFPKSRSRPEWFELFDGPVGGGVSTLARHLRHGADYEVLYRHWSARVHGSDAVQRFKRGGVVPLRATGELNATMNFVVTFGLRAIRAVIQHYMPEREKELYAQWYVAEVRQRWTAFGPFDESDQRSGLE